MRINKSEEGFGLVEGLLIVLVIFAIGGMGFYVYSQQKDSDLASYSAQYDIAPFEIDYPEELTVKESQKDAAIDFDTSESLIECEDATLEYSITNYTRSSNGIYETVDQTIETFEESTKDLAKNFTRQEIGEGVSQATIEGIEDQCGPGGEKYEITLYQEFFSANNGDVYATGAVMPISEKSPSLETIKETVKLLREKTIENNPNLFD